MMEGQEYMEDEEPVFHFDDEDDETAAMDTLADEDLIENLEPLTPVGSAGPTAPVTAPGSRRTHPTNFSSAQIWQYPEHNSPLPSLSHSLSPRVVPSNHYRPEHHSRSSRRSRQTQLSRQGSDQSLGQRAHQPQPIYSQHHEDLQQLDPYTLQQEQQVYGMPPGSIPSGRRDVFVTDAELDAMKENGDYVEIPVENYEQMFNGNEADRITKQKFQDEVIRAIQQNGRVVFMVGQASAQWWLGPEMQKRRKAAGRRMLDIGGAVASGASNVLMNNTPVGGVVRSVSTNVSAFRAAPFRYTMRGLGIVRKDAAVVTVTTSTSTEASMPSDGLSTPTNGRNTVPEPAIVEDDYDQFDDEEGLGMFGALDMDGDDDL